MAAAPKVVEVKGSDGQMSLNVWEQAGDGPKPAVIVIQEIFGVDDHIKDIAGRLADAGYVAAAPDLFYRDGKNASVPYSDFDRARELRGHIEDGPLTVDLQATFDYLTSQPGVDSSRIGIIGFCFGGRVTFLAAERIKGIAAAAPFYPGGFENLIDDVASIGCPIAGFFGNDDQNPKPEVVDQMVDALNKAGKQVEVNRFDGAGHGFMCTDRGSYNEAAATAAWPKVIDFFGRTLGS
jgi:carboxymethylenebutenolidase